MYSTSAGSTCAFVVFKAIWLLLLRAGDLELVVVVVGLRFDTAITIEREDVPSASPMMTPSRLVSKRLVSKREAQLASELTRMTVNSMLVRAKSKGLSM